MLRSSRYALSTFWNTSVKGVVEVSYMGEDPRRNIVLTK